MWKPYIRNTLHDILALIMIDIYAQFKKHVLANGLTLYHYQTEKPFIIGSFIVHAGNRHDSPGKEGVAHFLEHMVSRSMPSFPSYEDNRKFFSDVGGSVMFGMTGASATSYAWKLPDQPQLFLKGFQMIGELLFGCSFTKEVLEKQKKVITEEFNRNFKNDAHFRLAREWSKRTFPQIRTAHSSGLGTLETIQSMSIDDVKHFYSRHYVPKNVSVIVTGNISETDLISTMQNTLLGTVHSDIEIARLSPFETVSPVSQKYDVSYKEYTGEVKANAQYARAWFFVPDEQNKYTLRIIAKEYNRRVFNELREKRSLGYSAGVSLYTVPEYWYLYAYATVRGDSVDQIDELVLDILNQMSVDFGWVSENKQGTINRIKMLDVSLEDLAEEIHDDLVDERRVLSTPELIAGYESVTPEQVATIINDLKTLSNSFLYIERP